MTRKPNLFNRIGGFFAVLGAASATAAAVEAKRVPNSRDLEILGVDPKAFNSIRR
jgi:hypothetical protein